MKKRKTLVLVLFLFLALPGKAENQGDKKYQFQLKGGARMVIREDAHSATASLNLWTPAGYAEEGEEHGLAFLTAKVIKESIRARLSARGLRQVDCSCCTGPDFSFFSLQVPSAAVEKTMVAIGEALRSPDFSLTEAKKNELLAEINLSKKAPLRLAFNLFLNRTFPNHPYGRAPEGETASVSSLDAEKAKRFLIVHCPASELSFVAVGGPSSGQLASTFSYAFNGLSNETFTAVPLPESSPLSGIATASLEAGPSAIVLGSSGPNFTQFRQGVALDLLASILKRALSGEGQDCLSWWDFRRGSGLFAIAFQGDRKTIDKMAERTLILLENVRNGSFSPDELSRAQASLLAAFAESNGNDLARQLGFFNTLGSPVALDTYPPVVRQITPAEIQEAAQRWLSPSRIVVAKVIGQ
ncbi:MAG TPA: hypothetical protein DD435_05945 [Cyanobacteria bacterium UBA8530]|nr:hypothetical protein [Cyanobacteria bacterium UBA8530]